MHQIPTISIFYVMSESRIQGATFVRELTQIYALAVRQLTHLADVVVRKGIRLVGSTMGRGLTDQASLVSLLSPPFSCTESENPCTPPQPQSLQLLYILEFVLRDGRHVTCSPVAYYFAPSWCPSQRWSSERSCSLSIRIGLSCRSYVARVRKVRA